MIVTLYNCNDPTIKLDKTLQGPLKTTNVQPQPTDGVDVVNPIFILDDGAIPSTANYLVAGEPLNRSYFITSITYATAKTAIVSCHIDLLGTYKTRINAATLNYLSGAEKINEVEDEFYPLSDLYINTSTAYKFPSWGNYFRNSQTGKCYVLRVAAGKARSQSVRTLSIGDRYQYLGRYVYELAGTAEDAECVYINETQGGSYPIVKAGDIIKIGNYKYKFVVGSDAPTYGRLDKLF